MELTWYGRTCVRMRGKDAVVVADAYQSVVGPTGRGITGDIVTFSHPDDSPLPKSKGRLSRDGTTVIPGSLEDAFCLDGPGEYEVKDVLITGIRTHRDDHKGKERGRNVAFIVELDGVHVIHLGDIGHLLTEDKLTDIGPVDVACIAIGGTLPPNKAAELVSQLDAKVVVPMPVCDRPGRRAEQSTWTTAARGLTRCHRHRRLPCPRTGWGVPVGRHGLAGLSGACVACGGR